jgi:plasmid stability protein
VIALPAVQSPRILRGNSENLMGSLTIRKLDENVKKRLRIQAARHGRSMEEEARLILAEGLKRRKPMAGNLADAIAAIVDPVGGIELDFPSRDSRRDLPNFEN